MSSFTSSVLPGKSVHASVGGHSFSASVGGGAASISHSKTTTGTAGGMSAGYSTSGYGQSSAMVSTTSNSNFQSSSQNTRKVSEVVTSDQLVLPKNAYEQSSRKISSVVVFEEQEKIPEKNIRYVEVPQYEEVIKTVVIKETKVVEKIVQKVVEEWVERIVEIPQIEEVIRHVEVPQIVETIKHVPRIEVVDRPFEVIKEVKKTQINKVERVQEIGAETIEVPKANIRQETVNMTNYNDTEAMLVVGQKIRPVIVDGGAMVGGLALANQGTAMIDMVEYAPEVMPVDIHVAKFVDQDLVMTGVTESWHKVVTVSAAQYNSMLRYLNKNLDHAAIDGLPFLTGPNGQVEFLPQDFQWQSPAEGLKIYGYRAGQIWGQGSVVHTASKGHGMSQQEFQSKQQQLDHEFQQIFSQYEQQKNQKLQQIEQFNQMQIEKVQREIQSSHSHSYSHGQSHGQSHGAIGYSTTQSYNTQGSSSAFKAGKAIGSAVGQLTHH